MSRFTRLTISFATLAAVAACASARGSTSASANLSGPRGEGNNGDVPTRAESPSTRSDAIPIPTEITRAVETRISDLKNRGGDCQRLGTVLESSYRSGQITLRPYMWRVGTHLASGEGKPNGDMVLAREIDSNPKVLIAAQPTRGLDVGAIEYLHRRLIEERDEGRAILLVSLELDEVLSLSDRILVMYEGQIVAEHTSGTTEEEIGIEMLGGRRQAEQAAS